MITANVAARKLVRGAVLLLCLTGFAVNAFASDAHAQALLAAVDKALFLESYTSRATMETTEPGQQPKIMGFDGQSTRSKGTYMEVTEPARTKGTRFLQLEGSLWMFNPKAGSSRAVRLSARDSFQGSTFSNADVGKSQFSDEYDPVSGGEQTLDHPELGKVVCNTITATAKTADAAYGKIVMWLRKSDNMPLQMEYYAKSGLLFKRMVLSKIVNFGSITRPSVMRMESLEKKDTITTMTLLAIEIKSVPDSVFNKNYLTR